MPDMAENEVGADQVGGDQQGPVSLLNALLGAGTDGAEKRKLQLAALASTIESTVSSYDDAFDQLPEMVQNALDAIAQKFAERTSTGESYQPKVTIEVNEEDRQISVLDNGCGVPEEHFHKVFEPNVSVKQLLRLKDQRGHKGAAVVYLQFDHSRFEFQVKCGAFRRCGTLLNGHAWRKKLREALASGVTPPEPEYVESTQIDPTLETYDSGAFVRVQLVDPDACSLFDGLFSTADVANRSEIACKRIEYLLRTRTGIGYVADRVAGLPAAIAALGRVQLVVRFKDSTVRTEDVHVGFLYPHLDAAIPSAEILNKGTPRTLEMLYQEWNVPLFQMKNIFSDRLLAPKRLQDVVTFFQPYGYFCYTARNPLYESIQDRFCKFPEQSPPGLESDLREYLKVTGVNGGFLLAVQGFPNGRLQQFLQRGGSEDKSRTFVLINFNGNYVPDYGRKSLHHDCRPFVNELCKSVMAFANDEKKNYLPSGSKGGGGGPGPAGGLANARETCKEQEASLRAKYPVPPFVSGNVQPYFTPQFEAEVAYQFLSFVKADQLKGFRIFGAPTLLMYDGLFDYDLEKHAGEYEATLRKLGVVFGAKPKITLTGHWLEYKKSCDQLVQDFNDSDGSPSKKWYELLNLLVCDEVDDQYEGYTLTEISHSNIGERLYYGVTHILRKNGHEHSIQVICLTSLRARLNSP
jgi:hypothetical protein